jgi:hypothetical protein
VAACSPETEERAAALREQLEQADRRAAAAEARGKRADQALAAKRTEAEQLRGRVDDGELLRLRVLCEQHGIAAVRAGPNGIAITKHDGTRGVLDLSASPSADRLQQVLEEVRSWCEWQCSASESSPSPSRGLDPHGRI